MNKYNLHELPFSKAKEKYFDKNRKKIEKEINFIERVPYNIFKNDPTLEWARTKYFKRIAILLNSKLKINANAMSLIGLLFAIFAFFSSGNMILFAFFILLNLFSDGLDGVIARITESQNRSGELMDVTCDTIASVIFVMALVNQNYLNSLVGILFVAVTIPYTILATEKSIKYINKAQSIGSRIAVGFGTFLLTLSVCLGILSVTQYVSLITVFFLAMSVFLLIALIQVFYKKYFQFR